jgi:two-component system, OmpR family, sensor histidine kinase BaeS
MLQRAVSNLLDNALKFTEKGEVDIKLYGEANFAILEVGDTGMGISDVDLLNVFKRFYRSERSLAFSGNGLGLSYVDAVVRAHQGQIEVSSVIEKGSVFKIKLPLVLKST